MFELPELTVLSRQINDTLRGKTIRHGRLGNTPHKFVWYNHSHEEFEALIKGKRVGDSHAQGRWLFTEIDPGTVLLMGEIGGKLLYHPPGAKLPDKYHLLIKFEDDSALSATTQMWGAYELYEAGQEQERQYVKGMRPTPLDEAFTQQYFSKLIDELLAGEKRSVKSLLTQDQLIPGLGNSIAQDILFQARLNPRRPLSELNNQQRVNLYAAILDAVHTVIELGGRYDETDLFGKSGGYVRRIDSKSAGRACTECGSTIEKMQYLGGACYFCPSCQE